MNISRYGLVKLDDRPCDSCGQIGSEIDTKEHGAYYNAEDVDKYLKGLLETSYTGIVEGHDPADTHNYLHEMSLTELRVVLAYDMWKDGMDWLLVLNIWDGTDKAFWSREIIINHLKHVFGRE